MLSFKDSNDGYYEFADDAPTSWYAHLTPCAPQATQQPTAQEQIDAERLGIENYKALIRREADALDAAGEPYKAIKLLKTIGE